MCLKLPKFSIYYLIFILFKGNSSFFDAREGLLLPVGMLTNIVVERKFDFSMGYPYGNCEIENGQEISSKSGFRSELYEKNTSLSLSV